MKEKYPDRSMKQMPDRVFLILPLTISSVDIILKVEISILDNIVLNTESQEVTEMKRKKKQVLNGTVRRVFRNFRYTECEAFGEYLHEMSLAGWHFRKWQMGLVFEKGEPADITYCVEVFPKGSEMDLKPEKQAEEYADYCEAAGWELIDGQRKFCVFRRRYPDAPPIVTEEERFANVQKAEWRQLALELFVPVLLTAEFWIRALGKEFPDWIFFLPYLWMLLVITLITAGEILQCGWMISWSVRGKRALREGRSVSYERQPFRRAVKWILVILLETGVMALLAWVGMPKVGLALAGFIFLILAFTGAILWLRPSRDTNWGIQIAGGLLLVFLIIIPVTAALITENGSAENRKALAQMPLTQADYCEMGGKPDHAEYVYQESIFGSWLQGKVIWLKEDQEENRLSYDVYRSQYPWVLNKIWETEKNIGYYRDVQETNPQQWKALEVQSNKNGSAVCARYEDALLFFYGDTPPAAYQTEIILEKLNLQRDGN